MPDHLPVACTLNATDFRAREALMAELGQDALVGAQQEGSQAVLRFADGGRIADRVAEFVAGEQACCAFLEMQVAHVADEIVLTIDAPSDAALVLADMVDAFRAYRPAT